MGWGWEVLVAGMPALSEARAGKWVSLYCSLTYCLVTGSLIDLEVVLRSGLLL